MTRAKVGIVTVTYNSAGVLNPFLRSLRRQTFHAFRLYVVDNDSHDDTLRILAECEVEAVPILNKTNVGFAEATNQGVQRALQDGCEFILLLNNDTFFGPALIDTLLSELAEHSADMITPKIMFADDPELIWFAGGGFSILRGFSGRHYGMRQRESAVRDTAGRCDFSPACCLLIRSDVFLKIGLLDPQYFLYFEDTDFCYRARHHNVSLWYTPEAVVFHAVGSLAGSGDLLSNIRFHTRGHAYFLYKYFGLTLATAFAVAYQGKLVWRYLTRQYSRQQLAVATVALREGRELSLRTR